MAFIITDNGEGFVDFLLENGSPVFTIRHNIDSDARRFATREEAVNVRNVLIDAFNLNPKIVEWENGAKKKPFKIPVKREVARA
jgi:hypothetical protein